MYTLPLATVGTVNLTASPAWSRLLGACELFQRSVTKLLAFPERRYAHYGMVRAYLGESKIENESRQLKLDLSRLWKRSTGPAPHKVNLSCAVSVGSPKTVAIDIVISETASSLAGKMK